MSIKAFALHTIHRRDETGAPQVVPASVTGKISVFDADDNEFAKLERLGAVRKATKEEIAIAKANYNAANGITDTDEASSAEDDAGKTAPASGAKGDPKATPKSAPKPEDAPKAEDAPKTAPKSDDDI